MLKNDALLQWYTGLASNTYHAQGQLATPGTEQKNTAATTANITTGYSKFNSGSLEGGQTGAISTAPSTLQSTTAKPQVPSKICSCSTDCQLKIHFAYNVFIGCLGQSVIRNVIKKCKRILYRSTPSTFFSHSFKNSLHIHIPLLIKHILLFLLLSLLELISYL